MTSLIGASNRLTGSAESLAGRSTPLQHTLHTMLTERYDPADATHTKHDPAIASRLQVT